MKYTYCHYYVSDEDLLEKYGVKNLSTFDHFFSHVLLLTSVLNKRECFFNESVVSKKIELNPEEDQQDMKVSYALSGRHNILDAYRSVRDYVKLFPNYEYYKALCSKWESMPFDELEHEYPHLLVAMIQQQAEFKKSKSHTQRTAELILETLKELGCDKVRVDFRRHPFVAPLATSLSTMTCWDAAVHYMICEIYGIRERIRDKSLKTNLEDCVAVVVEKGQLSPKFFKNLGEKTRYVIYVLNESQGDKELLSLFMAKGILADVVANMEFTSVVVLDLDGGHNGVNFKRLYADGIRGEWHIYGEIPYAKILAFDCSLNYDNYTEPECRKGQEIVRLKDICDVDKNCDADRYYIKGKIPQYYFARVFKTVSYNSEHPGVHQELFASIYKGPHLHITDGCEFLLSKTEGYYFCPATWNISLRAKDNNISLQYLAYELGTDVTFMNFMRQKPSVENFLERKVALFVDRAKQDEIVALLLDFNNKVVNSPARYDVAFIDLDVVKMFDSQFDNFMMQDSGDLSEDEKDNCLEQVQDQLHAELTHPLLGDKLYSWQIDASKFEHITGEQGFLKALENKEVKPNAIIVDPLTDSVRDRYKGLRELLSKLRDSKIPVYLYTDVDQILLEDDLESDDYNYFINGRLYKKSDNNSMRKLIAALRTELDNAGNSLAKLQGDFIREFEAAKWIDARLPKLHVVSTLSFCLLHTNTSLNSARGLVNALYQAIMREISNGSGLEMMDEGMFPSLMQKGTYMHNNQILFTLSEKVMPLPLAHSLRYASDILNSASHQEDIEKMDFKGYLNLMNSDNIANAVLRIIMEFILWIYDVKFKFSGYCISEDVNVIHKVIWKGTLQQVSEREYYCETTEGELVRVYVNFQKNSKNGPERVGTEIIINKVSIETQMRDKYKWKVDKLDWE